MQQGIITLTTDFGSADNYVGAMKGSILTVCRNAQIVDISHAVEPQDIEQAVYLTSTAWPYYPPDAIHVAVVDPGVGTERKAVVLKSAAGVFVGPDNGVLSAALPPSARPSEPGRVRVEAPLQAFEITEQSLFRGPLSATFHGRDLFGPVAAHLAAGLAVEEVGPPLHEVLALPVTSARRDGPAIAGRILHVDAFGNLISDVPEGMLRSRTVAVEVKGQRVEGLRRTYGEAAGLFCLITSDGWLAVALPNGSAASYLRAKRGDRLVVFD